MKAVIRAFIAIELSQSIRLKLEETSRNLQSQLKDVPIRWVPVDNIHLTLKFLGDVSTSNLGLLQSMLDTCLDSVKPFELSVGQVGAFPNARRARVLWVGVSAPPELKVTQRGIESQMESLGYTREERPFSPHLTLGRVGKNARPNHLQAIAGALENSRTGALGTMQVQAVHLFKSDLLPGGAVYTRIHTSPLKP
jgi:2'-5' RNA ligase